MISWNGTQSFFLQGTKMLQLTDEGGEGPAEEGGHGREEDGQLQVAVKPGAVAEQGLRVAIQQTWSIIKIKLIGILNSNFVAAVSDHVCLNLGTYLDS